MGCRGEQIEAVPGTATGKTICTGPRGGRYHYSKTGKKSVREKIATGNP